MTDWRYSSKQTENSREVLDELLALIPNAVLIGGWASWVRTKGPMSHDIDLIISHAERNQIGAIAVDMSESTHVGARKWRATYRDIHVDLYVPHQSRLGEELKLRTEDLTDFVEVVESYRVLTVGAHIATKWAGLMDRPYTLPGQKDRYELLQLLALPGADEAPSIIKRASERDEESLARLIREGFEYLRTSKHAGGKKEIRKLDLRARAWETELTSP
jgi:hypothetical protein